MRRAACGNVAASGAVCVLEAEHKGALHWDGQRGVWRKPARQYVPCQHWPLEWEFWCCLEYGHEGEHEPLPKVEALLPLGLAFKVLREMKP